MKKSVKLISILTITAILLCMTVLFVSAKTVTYLKGDADGDGTISVLDATTIQKTLASLIIDYDGMIALRGEVGGDSLDITDATYIQKYLAHLKIDIDDINKWISIEVDPTEATEETASEVETQAATEPSTEPPTQAPTDPPVLSTEEYELPFIPSR